MRAAFMGMDANSHAHLKPRVLDIDRKGALCVPTASCMTVEGSEQTYGVPSTKGVAGPDSSSASCTPRTELSRVR